MENAGYLIRKKSFMIT